jgi:hypothetical protein
MNQQLTREILWNVLFAFRIFLYAMLLSLAAAFVYEGIRWYRIVSLGQRLDRLDQPGRRCWLLPRDTAEQGSVTREICGWLHYAFYVEFIRTTIILFNDEIAEAAGLFGFSCYLVGMLEVL